MKTEYWHKLSRNVRASRRGKARRYESKLWRPLKEGAEAEEERCKLPTKVNTSEHKIILCEKCAQAVGVTWRSRASDVTTSRVLGIKDDMLVVVAEQVARGVVDAQMRGDDVEADVDVDEKAELQ